MRGDTTPVDERHSCTAIRISLSSATTPPQVHAPTLHLHVLLWALPCW